MFEVSGDVGGLGCGLNGLLSAACACLRPGAPRNVAVFLPRNSHVPQMVEAVKACGVRADIECAFLNGRMKGVTLYTGDLCRD